jgi:UDP-N-acetylmuramate--alanine ligase
MLSREEVKKIDLKKLKKVHLIGITSSFNSFCAERLLELGVQITASEFHQDSEAAKKWIEKGILYPGGHNADYITKDLDLVIYPNAPIPGNPECEKAQELGIPSITIGQLTGLLGKDFKVIAIAGTHGKTTTTAFIIWILKNAFGQLPSFIIGDKILGIEKTYNYNPKSEYLVIESCEYKRQFLDRAPSPYISVITNIELDHTDYYKDLQDYNSAFSEFLSNTQNSIVIDRNKKNSNTVLRNVNTNVNIVDVQEIKGEYKDINSPMPGKHNKENLLSACGVAKVLNIDVNLEDFPGINSRFEYKGKTVNGMPVYLDYAHNPKKMEACLQEAKEVFPDKKILFVWQPHNFERTYTFREEFAKSIKDADIVLIPNIYVHIREIGKFEHLISVEEFVKLLKERNPDKDIRFTDGIENTRDILVDEQYDDKYIAVIATAGDLKNILNMLTLEK